jgi:hypothetical protein
VLKIGGEIGKGWVNLSEVNTGNGSLRGGDPFGLASPFAKATEDKSEAALHGGDPFSPSLYLCGFA